MALRYIGATLGLLVILGFIAPSGAQPKAPPAKPKEQVPLPDDPTQPSAKLKDVLDTKAGPATIAIFEDTCGNLIQIAQTPR